MTEILGPALLARLPPGVDRPDYDRAALRPGMAHIGVGAFHRCHQAEFTDDMLAAAFGRWGVIGINVRPPRLADTLGAQGGLYTRLRRSGDTAEARVVGSILRVVDGQDDPGPALAVLASPDIDVVTMTVTEKSYCHRPADGALDRDRPEIAADIADPGRPTSLPGLLVRALELRMQAGTGPVTLMSCDNVPANGVLLGDVVRALAERRGTELVRWIEANAAFPSAMVDRISPATTPADLATVEATWGYCDAAVAVCEPFRQWVIEDRFAARRPPWDLAGASFVADVTPFEQLKMRVLNAAQSTLAHLGVLAGHEFTYDSVGDPLLEAFVRRMLVTESLPTLPPVPGIEPAAYVDGSLARLHNRAIRHRCQQIATDGSQKIVQRLLNPARERVSRGQPTPLLALATAGWMAYLVRTAPRFGSSWTADDPQATTVAALAERIGNDPAALTAAILALDDIFAPELATAPAFRRDVTAALAGLLSDRPMQAVARALEPLGQVQ
ncbi:MAG: mannitol dehydrogenase family protein [Amaricoccus sp.]